MASATDVGTSRLRAALREEERVTPLELFFDLVFVLAVTQCTAVMAADPTWKGVGRALLMLPALWWGWAGYAWRRSVLCPDEATLPIAMFASMGAILVAALAGPH